MSSAGPCPNCARGELAEVEALRFGVLVRCDKCDLVLYLNARGAGHDVNADDVRFLRAWNATQQRLPAPAIDVLKNVGVRIERSRGDVARIEAACRAQIDGAWLDPVRVLFVPFAPVGWPDVILASRVTELKHSAFALPLEVREAAASESPVLFRHGPTSRFLRLRKGAVFVNEDGLFGGEVNVCWRGDIDAVTYERELANAAVVGTSDAPIVVADLDDVARGALAP